MRTTLTLEEDVARQVRRRMAEKKLSLEQVVNEALRVGFSRQGKEDKSPPFKVQPHSFGLKAGFDQDRLGQALDDLAVEDFMRKPRDEK